jgi:hypothetical protein
VIGSTSPWAARVAALGASAAMIAALAVPASGQTTLAAGRAYELVSPVDKSGGDVAADSQRTRAATDGSAVGFVSLIPIGEVAGTGVATDYISVRSTDAAPQSSGWTTHPVTPRDGGGSVLSLFGALEPLYVGEFSDDLERGVYSARSPLTNDPNVTNALNLYRRTDLLTPGAGAFDVLTACPLCAATTTPLAPLPADSTGALNLRPWLAGASPDFEHVAFESRQILTSDTPATPGNVRLFEWENGAVRLAGRIPTAPATECDDAAAPVCAPADVSIGGMGAGANHGPAGVLTPNVVSDGSDGHTRIFFTRPTNLTGTAPAASGFDGHVYMRVDGTRTVQLNASERTPPASFARVLFLNASADGTRAFFSTQSNLINGIAGGANKLYMYDATKPQSAPDNLTLISADSEPADGTGAVTSRSIVGVSDDGRSVYFMALGQLIPGVPLAPSEPGLYLWHDGVTSFVGRVPTGTAQNEIIHGGTDYVGNQRQARVTPDGRHVLFSSITGAGLLGYDHGTCSTHLGIGCRQLYVYSADTRRLSCASCKPSGGPADSMATTVVRAFSGGTQTAGHETTALAQDGSRAFFSTADALVPEDTNGRVDAYEYDVASGAAHLLSSGTAASDSWFMDASADGSDAFFLTRERLVGWDVDEAYDLYDARVGGGFPEPVAPPAPCAGDACQGAAAAPPVPLAGVTGAFRGVGNVIEALTRQPGARPSRRQCRRGFVRKRVRGKRRCVRRRRAVRGAQRGRAERAERTQRRGS